MMVPLDIIIFVLRHYRYVLLGIKLHKKMFEWFCIMKPDIIWRPLCFHWSKIKDSNGTTKPKERTKTTKSN
tara:strand:- start:2022 stop:2234 length:213 start_codon:yes stop_codon:yes gene_type:complete